MAFWQHKLKKQALAWTAAGKRIQTTAVRFCSTDLKRVVHVVEGRGIASGSGRPAGALTSPKKLPLSCTRAGRERLGFITRPTLPKILVLRPASAAFTYAAQAVPVYVWIVGAMHRYAESVLSLDRVGDVPETPRACSP